MSTPSKAYLDDYKAKNKAKLAAQQSARDAKKRVARQTDPVAMAAYRAKRRQEYLKTHPEAKTRESIVEAARLAKSTATRAKTEITVDGTTLRTCQKCQDPKTLDKFPRQGVYGHKKVCKECSKPVPKIRTTKARKQTGKELPRFVVSDERKVSIPNFKTPWDAKLLAEGWVKLLGLTDISEWCKVYIRHGVILYVRGSLGSYSTGKQTYGVMFDDSGKRYPTLGAAEKVVQRMQA
jgi:hypothetical protein